MSTTAEMTTAYRTTFLAGIGVIQVWLGDHQVAGLMLPDRPDESAVLFPASESYCAAVEEGKSKDCAPEFFDTFEVAASAMIQGF